MVGSALMRRLLSENCELITISRGKLDLRNQSDVSAWIRSERPDAIFLAAATVGGILANSQRPADFLYDNLTIETNIIHAARQNEVAKLLFLGSSCIYPKFAEQPIVEEALLKGELEPTNEWYAIAKIAGVKLCQAYRAQHGARFVSAMPTNLYGPNDNFDLTSSHVLPALIAKIHLARMAGIPAVELWGSGRPRREFLHVDDLADALVFLMKAHETSVPINVGSGKDCTILELAEVIAEIVGFTGRFQFDATKPDGTPRKLLDVSKLTALGWSAKISLQDGIRSTYEWYLQNVRAAA
jgi:GDP-L-fucose synthase